MDVMKINSAVTAAPKVTKTATPAEMTKSFDSFLTDALENVNQQQAGVEKLNQKFISGELEDVHTLLIASEKANLSLQLTAQIRNKVVEAYQEIMRMQV